VTPRWSPDRPDMAWISGSGDVDAAQTPAASAPTPGAWGNTSWGGGWDNARGSSAYSAETPAAAPTPAAADTPAPSYANDEYDAEHDHWIFRFPVEDKRGIVVTIINGPDGAGDRYDEGALDGARGVIISLQDPGKLDRAFVYMKLVESGSELNVPVKYIAQTIPEKKGDRVVLLENLSGWKAGTVCTASGPPSGGMVTLTSEQGQLQVNPFSVCLHQSL